MKITKKKNISLYHNKVLRRIRRKNKIKKQLRIRRNRRSPYKLELKRNNKVKRRNYDYSISSLKSPINFSLIDNTEEVIKFINAIDKIKTKKYIRTVRLDLSIVKNIEICAISLLLTKINELSFLKKFYFCIMPKDDDCRKIIEDSGFLDKMRNVGSGAKHQRDNKNLMITKGFDKTDNKATGQLVSKSVEHLTQEEGKSYRPLYSIIQEICSNSIEHANINVSDKNWLMSANFKKEEIEFTLTDIGEGIIKTIKKKALDEVLRNARLISAEKVLLRAFEKQYSSRTLDINRNKGLPKIYEVASKNYIENLIVITNNVLMDFSNIENSRELKINFNGTFYYWKLTKTCIERWKTRIKH